MEKIFIRRTRQNILNDAEYAKDIAAQGIVFPTVEPPNEILYKMQAADAKKLEEEKYNGFTQEEYRDLTKTKEKFETNL